MAQHQKHSPCKCEIMQFISVAAYLYWFLLFVILSTEQCVKSQTYYNQVFVNTTTEV